MEIGKRIKAYRSLLNFSQDDLAKKYLYQDKPFLTGKRTRHIQISKV